MLRLALGGGVVLGLLLGAPAGYVVGSWKTAAVERQAAQLRAHLAAAQAARDAAQADLHAAELAAAEAARLAEEDRGELQRAMERLNAYRKSLEARDVCRADDNDARYLNGLSNDNP